MRTGEDRLIAYLRGIPTSEEYKSWCIKKYGEIRPKEIMIWVSKLRCETDEEFIDKLFDEGFYDE